MDQSFGKGYKLCSKKLIDEIFNEGHKLNSFPFGISYKEVALKTPEQFQMVISVPKRNFKHAVDRNRNKRLIRECVRKNKLILEQCLQQQGKQIGLILVYRHKEELEYVQLEKKLKKAFDQLIERLEQ